MAVLSSYEMKWMKTVVSSTEVLALTEKLELVKPRVYVLKSKLYIVILSAKLRRVRIIQVIVQLLFNIMKNSYFRTQAILQYLIVI